MKLLADIIRMIVEGIDEYDPYDRDSWNEDDENSHERVDLEDILDSDSFYFMSFSRFTGFKGPDREQDINAKPDGLWYAPGLEWINFVKGRPGVLPDDWYEEYQFVYEIQPMLDSMIVVSDGDGLEAFNAEFGAPFPDARNTMRIGGNGIDWRAVAQRFAGIQTGQNVYSTHDTLWYDSWDVASGCIWDKRAIDWVQLVAQRDVDGVWERVQGRSLQK